MLPSVLEMDRLVHTRQERSKTKFRAAEMLENQHRLVQKKFGFERQNPLGVRPEPAQTPRLDLDPSPSIFSTLWALFRIFPRARFITFHHIPTLLCTHQPSKFHLGPPDHEC
jgi:hypothetical protein